MRKWSLHLGALWLIASAGNSFAAAKLLHFDKAHKKGQFIVHLKDGTVSRSFFRQAGVAPIHAFSSAPAYLVTVENGDDLRALEALRQNPDVSAIEANRTFKMLVQPSDPNFAAQYFHQRLKTPDAWEITTGSKDVIVGVIDSGVNYLHPDLVDNMWTNPGEAGLDSMGRDKASNQIDDDGNGYVDDVHGWDFVNNDNDPMDDHGHGSHCAGIIGAKGNNELGVTGINWNVSIAALKFINGQTGEGDIAGATAALEYATAMGISITNNSYGGVIESLPGPDEEDIMRDAIAAAAAKGYLFVAAAGNEAMDNDVLPSIPASYPLPNIISVAATNSTDAVAFFSNYGANSVHIGAPGVSILSTVLGSGYKRFDGTSMASPMVAGAAALVKAQYPEMDAVQLKQRLMESSDPLPALDGITISGGRLNLAKALAQ